MPISESIEVACPLYIISAVSHHQCRSLARYYLPVNSDRGQSFITVHFNGVSVPYEPLIKRCVIISLMIPFLASFISIRLFTCRTEPLSVAGMLASLESWPGARPCPRLQCYFLDLKCGINLPPPIRGSLIQTSAMPRLRYRGHCVRLDSHPLQRPFQHSHGIRKGRLSTDCWTLADHVLDALVLVRRVSMGRRSTPRIGGEGVRKG